MFFSVKTAIKIAGKVFVPCVCYAINETLAPTIDKLVAEGKAYKYSNRVYFQNGKLIEKKPIVQENRTVEKLKKTKKEKAVEEKAVEETTVEEVPSPEEVADNLGGF